MLFYAPERRVVLAAQDVQKLFELHPDLLDYLLALRDIRLRFFAGQSLSCATNSKTIIIQEATNLTDNQNVLTLVITTIATPFYRFQLWELLLPIPEYVRLYGAQITYLTYREVTLSRYWG